MKDLKHSAVVLLQLGGPDSLDAVKPFLYNLFCDPDIIDIPGAFLFRKILAAAISKFRSPKVVELYKSIGNKSPIYEQSMEQADALKNLLKEQGLELPVFIAMRYWHPFTEEVVDKLIEQEINELILVPLYPQYSKATTGSSVNELDRVLKRKKSGNSIRYTYVHSYHEHPLYIKSIIDRIQTALLRFPQEIREKVFLVFSSHGTPMKLVREGDPYSHQMKQTYEEVIKTANFAQSSILCFQSKVGPQKWLEPSLIDTIDKLAGEGVKYMLVIPIAFVSEHIETLSEINIEARKQATDLGILQFETMPALRDHPDYIGCLAELVREKINENNIAL